MIATIATPTALTRAGFHPSGTEDDGGADVSGVFTSTERLTTGSGAELTLALATYPSVAAATSGFAQLVQSQGGRTWQHVADQSAVLSNGAYVVRAGGQVLQLSGRVSDAAEQRQIKRLESGTQTKEQFARWEARVVQTPLKTLVKAAGSLLPGATAASPSYTYVPAGAVNPCNLDPSGITGAMGTDVTATAIPSDDPPAQECQFTGSQGVLDVYVITGLQAHAAAPSTSVSKVVSDALATAIPTSTHHEGPFTLQNQTGPDGAVALTYTAKQRTTEIGVVVRTAGTLSYRQKIEKICDYLERLAKDMMKDYDDYYLKHLDTKPPLFEEFTPQVARGLVGDCVSARGGA